MKSWVLDNRNLGEVEIYVTSILFKILKLFILETNKGLCFFVHEGIMYLTT